MRGRHPKPGALKEAQGNPGKREIPREPEIAVVTSTIEGTVLPFAKLSVDAASAYAIVGTELKRMNFVRPSDEPLLLRYCDSLARYWRVTATLDRLGGETYELKTVSGDVMQRMRPEFAVQERLAKRLESMEDRLGLSPMARQQYLLRMSQSGVQLPLLSKQEDPAADDDDAEGEREPVRPSSPIGLLKHGLN